MHFCPAQTHLIPLRASDRRIGSAYPARTLFVGSWWVGEEERTWQRSQFDGVWRGATPVTSPSETGLPGPHHGFRTPPEKIMSAPRVLLAASAAFVFASVAPAQSLLHSDTTHYLALDDVEITPNQQYAVVRQNNVNEYALVFDMNTGLKIGTVPTSGVLCGDCVDAVAVTNDRAVVLGGDQLVILDLTQAGTGNLLMATFNAGYRPNDLAITPNGRWAAVRGGSNFGGGGGQFIFDLMSGTQVGNAPGNPPLYTYSGPSPYSYDNDSVAVSNDFAVMLSIVGQSSTSPRTRITVWNLSHAGGPSVVYETGVTVSDIFGAPHDVAITPDGVHAVVRTEYAIVVMTLPGAVPGVIWAARPYQGPGPFDDTALDSVEVSNTRIVTISNVTNPLLPQGTQVDIFDFSGNVDAYDRMAGTPHDLAVTPDGTRAVVRTTEGVFLYDISTLATQHILPIGSAVTPSSTEGYQEGFDSVAVNDRYAVTLTHSANLTATDVWFWDIAHGHLDLLATHHITNSRPIDLAITPDSNKVVVTGNSSIDVFHLATGGLAFEHKPIGQNNWYQWCDGVAAGNEKSVGIAMDGDQSGWIDVVDMTPISQSYCTANPNSTGESASISALGKASVSANSLKLAVENTPAHARGRFVYGTGQAQLPFGDGLQCVAAPAFGLRFVNTNSAGAAFLNVNYNAQTIPQGIITAGSTWNFQFIYADEFSGGFGINSSNALSITFTP